MSQQVIQASELRDKLAEYLDQVERSRVLITKHGEERAYLISVRELRSLEETIAVLEDSELMTGLKKSLEDLAAGRIEDIHDAFSELDADIR